MGVQLGDLLEGKDVALDSLSGKILAIDMFNFLYQFLATIRGPDGLLLTTSQGVVTSHLVGLFGRLTRLMEYDIKCVCVFDGVSPALKDEERKRRKELKQQAQIEYDLAIQAGDLAQAKKLASRTSSLTSEMIADTKELCVALGLPVVQAPSEGEAQAAYLVKKGLVHFVASQDTDALLFGAPFVLKNVSIMGKKKQARTLAYQTVSPQVYCLSDILRTHGLSQRQLILIGMLCGTDFNKGGMKGIGPKNALKKVRELYVGRQTVTADGIIQCTLSPSDEKQLLDAFFSEIGWTDSFSFDYWQVIDLFEHMPVVDVEPLSWSAINKHAVEQLLCQKYEFTPQRVTEGLSRIRQTVQRGLGDFF
jgi:flap endonuclease-1